MRITVLTENTSLRKDLACEHGLSLYIETEDRKILFDAGQSSTFAENAVKLGIDLTQVDLAILSHGHYDHSGGFVRFLEINTTAPIYVSPFAFGPHYNASQKYIGADPFLAESGRLIYAKDTQQIAPGITLCSGSTPRHPVETWGLCRLEGEQFLPEDFRHEQYLLITQGDKRICLSGCSHKGILNIMDWFRPDVLIGGFHFVKMDPASPSLTAAGQILAEYPTIYYTGHCTGEAQFTRLKSILGQRLLPLSTGITITI